MSKIVTANWLTLRNYWDSYGHSVPWEKLEDIKSNNGLYAVVMWKEGQKGQYLICADLERAGHDQPWEMCNDGSDPITQEQWDGMKIPAECSWFEVPTEEELREARHERMMANAKYNEPFQIYSEGFADGHRAGVLLDCWFESATYQRLMKVPAILKIK